MIAELPLKIFINLTEMMIATDLISLSFASKNTYQKMNSVPVLRHLLYRSLVEHRSLVFCLDRLNIFHPQLNTLKKNIQRGRYSMTMHRHLN